MPLSFPTLAEQALAEFRTATKTVALARIAKCRGAEVGFKYPATTYTFDDDSSLVVTGRGKAHRVEVHLP